LFKAELYRRVCAALFTLPHLNLPVRGTAGGKGPIQMGQKKGHLSKTLVRGIQGWSV